MAAVLFFNLMWRLKNAPIVHVEGALGCLQVGLPVASKNAETWAIKKPFLGMPSLKASPGLIQEARDFMQAVLRLRYSTPLFRLPSAEAVIAQVP